MIKVGINYLYWTALAGDDPQKTLELTARTGAEVLEYPAKKLALMTQAQRAEFRSAAEARGMSIAVTGGMGPDFDLSSPDAAVRKNGVALARKALEICEDMGSPDWCGIIYARWHDLPAAPLTVKTRREVWDRAVDSVRQVAAIAEEKGIDLSIEIVNRFEVFLLTTVDLGLEFAEEVGSPRAKLLLDTFHMNIEECDMVAAVQKAAKAGRLGHLHAIEGNRQVPGLVKSDMPWEPMLAAVKDSGYSGVVSMEPFVRMDAPDAVGLATWRDLIDAPNEENMVAAAARGVAFLKGRLQ